MIRDAIVFLCLLACLLAVRQFLFEPVRVKGSSMLPTLHTGQLLAVSKAAYLTGEPQRGDVVICHYPNRYADPWRLFRLYFVKRVIGLPGETVEIVEGVVHIDGQPLEEDYLDPARNRSRRSMDARTLGPDEYFVMGDNRDSSNDSRRVGPLPRDMLVGRVAGVLFPFSEAHRITGIQD